MIGRQDTDTLAVLTTLGTGVIIAHQIAAKATRDNLYLDSFSADSLPRMVSGAALFSILLAVIVSRAMTAVGPAKLMPSAFAASALLHLSEWSLFSSFPKIVTVFFYLHFNALGAVLISGFWSVVNERFDPHTARKRIARITGGAATGALCGGAITWATARTEAGLSMLLLLAVMHSVCAAIVRKLAPQGGDAVASPAGTAGGLGAGVRLLRAHSYLRDLAMLVFIGAGSATLIGLVFMSRAEAELPGRDERLAFLALFYAIASIVTCVIQAVLARPVLGKAGLGITAGAYPAAITLGSLGAALAPGGVLSAAFARGSEQVIHNSLFRSAYELFYTPLPPEEKRCAKPLIDVGVERIGDLAGAAVGEVLSMKQPLLLAIKPPLLLGVAAGAGLLGLWISRRLDRGYVTALERSLRDRAVELRMEDIADQTTRATVIRTMAVFVEPARPRSRKTTEAPPSDPLLHRIAELRTGDTSRVRRALSAGNLPPAVAPHVIALLAWDDVAGDAANSLRIAGPGITGQLIDALLEDRTEFAIRRRIPRVLTSLPSRRALDALLLGLNDTRFEVRYHCGKALAQMVERNPELNLSPADVYRAASRELEVGKHLWEGYRLLDGSDADELVGERVSRGLQHVFTLLSLVLPRKPLRISFYALHTDDTMLRGTALEYLDSVLPPPVREQLRALLDETPRKDRPIRDGGEVLAALLESHESIYSRLLELRAKRAVAAEGG